MDWTRKVNPVSLIAWKIAISNYGFSIGGNTVYCSIGIIV